MSAVHATYYHAEFGASLSITYVVGCLGREFQKPLQTMRAAG